MIYSAAKEIAFYGMVDIILPAVRVIFIRMIDLLDHTF
jgi:hypothetical protein